MCEGLRYYSETYSRKALEEINNSTITIGLKWYVVNKVMIQIADDRN